MATRRAARPIPLFLVCIHLGLSACGGAAEQSGPPRATEEDLVNAGDEAPAPLPPGATEATWQELGLASVSNGPAVAATPLGYLALSRRSVGDAKAPSAWESYLYRSTDGVRWQQVTVSNDNDDLWLRGVAYGNGHYVLAGMRFGDGDGVIFHSTNGERWDEIPVATGAPSGLSDAVFTGGRFFALSTNSSALSSTDGTTWTTIDLGHRTAPLDVTFGNDRFLLVGSGDVQSSTDGLSWTPTALDCAMAGACITDPSGNVLQGSHARAAFSEGVFFIDQASSSDGQTWRSLPGLNPYDGVGGQVIGSTATDPLAIWSATQAPRALTSRRYVDVVAPGDRAARMRWNGSVRPNELSSQNFPNDAPAPDQLEFPLPSGADCTTSACVLVDHRLYLLQSQQ